MAQEANRCDACILERRAEIANSPENRKRRAEERAEERRQGRNSNIKLWIFIIGFLLLGLCGYLDGISPEAY